MRVGVVIVGLTLALSGCSGYTPLPTGPVFSPTPSVSMDERPTAKDAYLYGSFRMEGYDNLSGTDYMRVGLVILCRDGNSYTIPFSATAPIRAVKIAPSTCLLREIVYVVGGYERDRKAVPKEILGVIEFAPGKAYYLGDLVMIASLTSITMPNSRVIRWKWDVESVADNYDGTTSLMRDTFPNLADVPTEKKVIGDTQSSVSEDVIGWLRRVCSDTFEQCRISCGTPSCITECHERLDECRGTLPK